MAGHAQSDEGENDVSEVRGLNDCPSEGRAKEGTTARGRRSVLNTPLLNAPP